jgi:hypothetical protein
MIIHSIEHNAIRGGFVLSYPSNTLAILLLLTDKELTKHIGNTNVQFVHDIIDGQMISDVIKSKLLPI